MLHCFVYVIRGDNEPEVFDVELTDAAFTVATY